MAEYVTYPLNTAEYYDAADAQVYTATREKGVYANDHFNATVTGVDNSVTIAPGLAWAKPDEWSGVAFASKTPVKVDLPLADPSQPRFDLITIQFNSIREFRGEIDYIQGTPSSNPNYPETSKNNNVFELALYAVRRNVGAVTITAADIFDLRIDEQYCGIMRDGVTGIDTSVIVANVDETLAQLTAQGNATIEALDEALQSVLDRNGLMLKTEYADQPNVVNEAKVSQDAQEHISKRDNPHGITKAQVGLGNVSNVEAYPKIGGIVSGNIATPNRLDTGYGTNNRITIGFTGAPGLFYSGGGQLNVMAPGYVDCTNMQANGYVTARATAFTPSSSIRYKKNVQDISLEKAVNILQLRPVEYDLKSDGRHSYGFIAEEVAQVDNTTVHNDENGFPNTLDYMGLIAPLLVLVQNLTERIQALEKEREAQHDTI